MGLAPMDSDARAAWHRRRDEGQRSRALLMQHRADLAEFFGGCGGERLRSALDAGEWPGALGQRQRMVMPAEQKGLEQDRRDADQRDPAAGNHSFLPWLTDRKSTRLNSSHRT